MWRWPGLAKLATLTGHTMRVLYLAVSPDGQTIVTGAGALLPFVAENPYKNPRKTLSPVLEHTMRVLYLAVSPDGQTIVTGAGGFLPHISSSFAAHSEGS